MRGVMLAGMSMVALALSACGGNSEPAPVEETATPTETAAPSESAAPTESASPTETPSATPTPSATASTPAAPAKVAMAQPASFAICKACHSVEPGKQGIGPSLFGIYGEKAAAVPGFEFSDAMKASGLTWNAANLDKYLAAPQAVVPGTKMSYAGQKDAAKRQELIDYIKSLK